MSNTSLKCCFSTAGGELPQSLTHACHEDLYCTNATPIVTRHLAHCILWTFAFNNCESALQMNLVISYVYMKENTFTFRIYTCIFYHSNIKGCGATRQESSGIISFNATRGTKKQCQWRITAAYGEKVNLNITSLSIPDAPDVCSKSFLEIRDGHFQNSPLIGWFEISVYSFI
jgi:hypothetical protein